ncbi:MAG: MFS transporter [Actinomycetota bacterium]
MNGRAPLGWNYRKLITAAGISNLGDGIGTIAYPWLASAVTRNPLLISLVVVAQRLPWLLFSLPAGVITDRVDRAKLMVWSNVGRAIVTLAVGLVVLGRQGSLPGPDELAELGDGTGTGTDLGLYVLVLAATVLLGIGEVLFDNANQSFLPHIVADDQLEKANGRLWSVEQVANAFVGPPLGAILLVWLFALPFFVDAATFAVAAGLISLMSVRSREATGGTVSADPERAGWRAEIKEGFLWLWHHPFLRSLAIILGLLNLLGAVAATTLVLFAQEELSTTPAQFAALSIGGAVGGVIGGWTGASISKRIGPGPSLWLTLGVGGAANLVIAVTSSWFLVAVMFALSALFGTLWNVITVSLRQSIIPDQLLGRVNSVYRFFAWGMIPIGALLAGLIIAAVEVVSDRSVALRAPWVVAGIGMFLILAIGGSRLTTSRIEAARAAGAGASRVTS